MQNVASTGLGVKPNKTLIAVALVIITLAAFVVAFYVLGGQALVEQLLGSTAVTEAPLTQAAAPTASATSAGSLPPGVDVAFAQRVFVEQVDSQRNIAKLATGQIATLAFGEATTTVSGALERPVTATFSDGTSGPGVMGLEQRGGKWFFSYISGTRAADSGGLADTIARGNASATVRTADSTEVDDAVMKTMIAEQVKSQPTLGALADGTITKVVLGERKEGVGTVTLPVTITYSSGSTSSGHLVCISKTVDGAEKWFITSFTK